MNMGQAFSEMAEKYERMDRLANERREPEADMSDGNEQLREALRRITQTDWDAAEGITPFQFEQRIHAIAAAALSVSGGGDEHERLRAALRKAWRGELLRTEYLSAMGLPDPLDALAEDEPTTETSDPWSLSASVQRTRQAMEKSE